MLLCFSNWVRVFVCLVLMCVSAQLIASPSLNKFVQKIWLTKPEIQAAESALDAARARKQAASQAIYNPEIDVEWEHSNVTVLNMGINQRVDWGDKRSALAANAEADVLLKLSELNLQRRVLSENLLLALVSLQTTQRLRKLAHQRLALMQAFVKNTEKRYQAGDIGAQDLALARVALSEARIELANHTIQYVENETNLVIATGLDVTEWPQLIDVPNFLPELEGINSYLDQHPRINILKAKIAAAKSIVKLSRAQRKADPSFGVRGGIDDKHALVALNFSMPLYIRNSYLAEVEASNSEVLRLEGLFNSQMHQARKQIVAAHLRFQLAYDAWSSWQQSGKKHINEQFELIQAIWQSGEMSAADYLVQGKQNVDAQETAVDLSAQMWKAWIAWLMASGQIENWVNQTD